MVYFVQLSFRHTVLHAFLRYALCFVRSMSGYTSSLIQTFRGLLALQASFSYVFGLYCSYNTAFGSLYGPFDS